MRRLHAPALLASALLLATASACGGGGGGGTTNPPPPTTHTVSGALHASGGQRVDVDTADPNTSTGNNDTPGTAQAIPGAVTLGGWASALTDPLDYYRVTLVAGQVVTLVIGEADPAANDLDLGLFTIANTTTPVASSETQAGTESLTVPAGGEYYVVVGAYAGASNYVLTIGAAPAGGAAALAHPEREFVPGEVLVRFKDAALSVASAGDTLQARAAALGMVPLGGAVRGRHALLGLPAASEARAATLATLGARPGAFDAFGPPTDGLAAARADTLRAVKALRARADVQSADLNYVFHPSAVPNDEFYKFQWHYPLINLPQAWEITTGTPATGSVVVAVIDTGVFLAHPDMVGKLVPGYDFISNPAMSRDGDGIDGNPDDPGDGATAGSSSWHGTHVAGTVGAASNDTTGAAGVSWGARIMPVRVLGAGGGTSHDIIQGLRWAAGLSNDSGLLPAKRADVANLSLGCLGCFSQTEQDAYTVVRNAGLIVVAAAGNENSTTSGYPASYAGVVSVSAVDMALARAPYSNRGPNVDVAAPGGDTSQDRDGNGYVDGVLSALVDDSGATRAPIWTFYQGTSMASPHVAGVVALMKAVCPTLTPAQLDGLITSGAITRDLGTAGRDDVYGWGLIDALGAVRSAQTTCATGPAGHLELNPTRLDFSAGATAKPFAAAWVGTGALAVTGVADDAPWLTVTAGAVNGSGYGPYTATVNPAGLAAGTHSASVTFTLAGGGTAVLPVSLLVAGAGGGTSDAGYLYLLMVDPVPAADGTLTTLAQWPGRGSAGTYTWSFTGVPDGQYLLVAGSDSDDDGLICDGGEACGAWPTLGVPTPITVAGADVTGLDFLVGYEVTLGGASAAPAVPAGGFRKLTPNKQVEVKP